MSTRQTDARIAKEMSLLRILAHSQFRRTLHDVPRDGACQFASLLHALSTQLRPSAASRTGTVLVRGRPRAQATHNPELGVITLLSN
jgi:hypothetical protein